MQKDLISLIIPCFNEKEMVPIFYKTMIAVMEELNQCDVELIFINDGSTDNTLDQMRSLSQADSRVHYLSFSRNFGKEAAMYAGLKHAKGDFVAVMDVDLQDPPNLLPTMYRTLKNSDYDCVGTKRVDRQGEPVIRSFFAKGFYKLINRISDNHIVDGARDYRLMTRQMVDAVLELTEYNRFSKGIFTWVGFETKYIEYSNIERPAGKTSWSFWGLMKYSFDGIIAFSAVPLAIASFIGFIAFVVAVLLALFFAIRTLLFGNATSGWTSLMVMILGMGGLQLLCLGILGKYLGQTFLETKKRPIYILKETDETLKK
ncbi:glycosyltransferase family 2 protein [Jeotgalibaca arthritidis]|uniref:Glycosyltransferase family 2 protein n=1 Tax=Jeotgalibaca arthritidis TaxID=1868794 RepID=A0A6G7KB06_9LACT|nr:glycosyltransferase family 2 protein [Jeotgalibaca arthritidis]QII82454.1 glycosyltransferase family 2 protein [Jeotgalibaca arthritidis]